MSRFCARGGAWPGRRAALPFVVLAVASALLAACAEDQGAVAQSSEQVPSIQGVGAAAGQVTVDNALVLFPPGPRYAAGSDAPLSLVVTNGALTDDRLVSASSTAARTVEITPAAPGTTPPSLGCVLSPYEPTPPAEPVTETSTAVARPIPNGGTLIMTPDCPHLLLAGLTRDLTLLDTVPLRLTFAHAGTVALVLPVQTSNHPLPREVIPGVDNPTPGTPTPDSSG
jgi:copper(I)-binding protein